MLFLQILACFNTNNSIFPRSTIPLRAPGQRRPLSNVQSLEHNTLFSTFVLNTVLLPIRAKLFEYFSDYELENENVVSENDSYMR